jgi:hypothetical protein
MNDLEKYFISNKNKRLITKWQHYFDIYDRYFSKYRGTDVVFLEIGIYQGGSLPMWKEYFGEKSRIIGIDINPACKKFEDINNGIEVFIGSQSDKNFLIELKNKISKVDIILDDGGHTMKQQITSFENLFSHVKNDGLYMCEDVHTSYWLNFGGGFKRTGTFIEFSKNIIDKINAYHSEQLIFLKVDDITKSTNSIHFYDSIIVIEKKERLLRPTFDEIGNFEYEPTDYITFKNKLFFRCIKFINKVLRFFRLKSIILG